MPTRFASARQLRGVFAPPCPGTPRPRGSQRSARGSWPCRSPRFTRPSRMFCLTVIESNERRELEDVADPAPECRESLPVQVAWTTALCTSTRPSSGPSKPTISLKVMLLRRPRYPDHQRCSARREPPATGRGAPLWTEGLGEALQELPGAPLQAFGPSVCSATSARGARRPEHRDHRLSGAEERHPQAHRRIARAGCRAGVRRREVVQEMTRESSRRSAAGSATSSSSRPCSIR